MISGDGVESNFINNYIPVGSLDIHIIIFVGILIILSLQANIFASQSPGNQAIYFLENIIILSPS